MTRLPLPARWLLRVAPLPPEARADVQDDVQELFAARRRDGGVAHAHWRLYRDIASLWLQPRPAMPASNSRSLLTLLRDALSDLRYATRLFARQPAILLLTIVGLSLGLGIATAAFSIMNVAALRGEGLDDPARAPGIVRTTDRSTSTAWSHEEFLRLREGATRMKVEGMVSEGATVRTGPADANASSVRVAFVSGGFFSATGGRTTLGRPLEGADESPVGPAPVVVSFVFWTSRLNRDPAVIGRTIRVGRAEATVVGVAEPGFAVPNQRLLWMPLTAFGAVYGAPGTRAPGAGIEVFGRLMPGVTLSEAEAQLGGVAAAFPSTATGGESAVRVRLDTHVGLGRVSATDTFATAILVFVVIALVLLLTCANVATVLISMAITRTREMGVRAALGASRERIVRQLITESLALGTVAAAIGLLLAAWAIPVIGTMIEAPEGTELAPDLTVYLFLGIVTLVTGVVAGLAPARHGRSADLVTPLKGEGAGQDRMAPRRLRSMLVITQAAVSVLLLVMATLFVRATFRAATIDVGFDPTGLYTVSPGAGARNFWARATSDLQTVPGIASVALVELPPFAGLTRSAITREEPARVVYFNRTRNEYFEALGLRLLTGRTYTRDEIATRAPVALVSESLARVYWQDQSPLGQLLPSQIAIPELPGAATRPVIIGVVGDAITGRFHERNALAVYEPLGPSDEPTAHLILRVAPGTTGVIDQASQRLRSIDPLADLRITSVAALLEQETGRPRMLAALSGTVGLIAIVLCVIGLYGLTASVVGQRTKEMGVRVALGADRGDLLRLLMRDSLRPVVLGLVLGIGTALLVSRVLGAAMFFGVSPQDPLAYAGAAVALVTAATLAVLVPTRRAAAVDAAFVLRRS